MGTWVHWVLWSINPETREIKEGEVPKETTQGVNDFRRHKYGGPCPPSGTHRYFFKLYALNNSPDISLDSGKAELEKAMKGHVIDESQIMGVYTR